MSPITKLRIAIAQRVAPKGKSLGDVISGMTGFSIGANPLKKNVGYVWACINARSEAVARIEFKVNRRLPNGDSKEIANHDILKVLNNPNPQLSTFSLIEMTQQWLDAQGNAYWYFPVGQTTRKPKEIYLLPASQMKPVVDERLKDGSDNKFGLVTGYVYKKKAGEEIPFEIDEIQHFKMPNLNDPNVGVGVVQAGVEYIDTESIATQFSRRALENNAVPSGILTIKNDADADAFKEFKEKFRQEYGSVRNTGKIAIIQGGEAEFTKIGLSLGDIALKELKEMTRDDIMLMFRVSKPILGITEDVNLANAKVAEHVFAKRVVEPLMHRIVDALQPLMKRYGNDLELSFESPVPADMEAKATYLTQATAGLPFMTMNEARQAFDAGLAPLAGGDDLLVPFNLIPATDSSGGDSGGEGQKSSPKGVTKIVLQKVKKKSSIPTLTYEIKENFRLTLMKTQDSYEKKFAKKARAFVKAQKQAVLDALPEEKAFKIKAFEEVMFDVETEANKLSAATKGVAFDLSEKSGKLAFELVGAEPDDFVMEQHIQNHISDSIGRMSTSYNENTKTKLEAELSEALREQESVAQVKKRIERVYKEAEGYRAERIARSETLKASNYTAREAYHQSGYVQKLEWFANPDACEHCSAMNGVVIGIDQKEFLPLGASLEGVDENGNGTGKTFEIDYEDIENPPLHANCRCSVLPKFE